MVFPQVLDRSQDAGITDLTVALNVAFTEVSDPHWMADDRSEIIQAGCVASGTYRAVNGRIGRPPIIQARTTMIVSCPAENTEDLQQEPGAHARLDKRTGILELVSQREEEWHDATKPGEGESQERGLRYLSSSGRIAKQCPRCGGVAEEGGAVSKIGTGKCQVEDGESSVHVWIPVMLTGRDDAHISWKDREAAADVFVQSVASEDKGDEMEFVLMPWQQSGK